MTGAAGFVGANLVRRLLADGHEVNVLLRSGSDRWRLDDIERELRIHDAPLTDARRGETGGRRGPSGLGLPPRRARRLLVAGGR